MAPGERASELVVRTPTSAAARLNPPMGPVGGQQVLTTSQLRALDEMIMDAEQYTGLRFAAFLGDLGDDSRAGAESMLTAFGDDAPYTVLVALSPAQRVVEIVTGAEAALRISDRAARVAVLSVVASCTDGDLEGAVNNGIRILCDQAGTVPEPITW